MASALLVFLASSVWVAFSAPLMPAAAADRQGREHCPSQLCGNVNISFPFGLVPEEDAVTHCYALFQILSIFYDNASLFIAETQDHNDSRHLELGCYIPTGNVTSKFGRLFSISPLNQNLIFYNCIKPLPPSVGLAETMCRNNTYVRVAAERYDGHGSYFLEGCNSSVKPVLGRSVKIDAGNYEELMRDGFLVTWQWPPSGGSNRKIMIVSITCGTVGGILAVGILIFVWHKRKRRKQVGAPNGFMRSESSMQSYSKDLELGGSLHIFTYEELEEATDGFSDSRELGDGGFGTVYKGKLRDGRVVAVKRLYKNNYKRVEQFINEVDILSRLLHQNLVILYGCTSRSSRDLMLVYEYIPNGTVADHLHGPRASERGLTWPVRMNIAIETAEALAYLHAVEIIHRDVKTNNILLDNSFHVKVADFGLSRLYPLEVTHVSTVPQGTPGYVDPVYHQCYKLTDKSDVYSFGVVLVELISSKPAVDMGRSHSEINLANMALNRIQNHEVEQLVDPELGYETDDETKRMVDLVAELAFQCLQLERELRPSIKQVVEALNCIKNGDSPEKRMDLKSSPKEDSHLLKNSVQYSPDSVIHKFHSQSTTHSVASNASG
ncbi:hypothetical protein SEVIR_5G091400v4 [Setaria viridis]|uniref:LEAF RUST 10 DISEASE-RESISTANCEUS RECEPTOR-LIKE PROTEIN KINASE-like 1.2 isoform X7 n=1 Tax=Setaria viridis TaxID=4556 RepID=UPI0014936C1E|nr:LEAF RUST 10 DISEASE-RESISTANCE LOCUS RECEPTOR-LIKE PROTEIN KINASE-like 1.2 isoform X7 [Setaria viridis]